jgi:hypothetical protein
LTKPFLVYSPNKIENPIKTEAIIIDKSSNQKLNSSEFEYRVVYTYRANGNIYIGDSYKLKIDEYARVTKGIRIDIVYDKNNPSKSQRLKEYEDNKMYWVALGLFCVGLVFAGVGIKLFVNGYKESMMNN